MKKVIILLMAFPLLLTGCGKINSEIEELKNRIANLEGTTIASIEQQIASINKSIGDLNGMDTSLKGYLDALSDRATDLEKQAGEIPVLREAINGLKAQDGALEESIADLKSYVESLEDVVAALDGSVDARLSKEREWINATFCTLENYQSMTTEIANIREGMAGVERALGSRIDGVDASLDSLQQAFAADLKTVSDNLTDKIGKTEASMKKWVNEALAGYYDIAAIDAKLAALSSSAEAGQDAIKKDLDNLSGKVDQVKADLTAAYKKAVAEAIADNEGVISSQIASAIEEVEARVSSDISDL